MYQVGAAQRAACPGMPAVPTVCLKHGLHRGAQVITAVDYSTYPVIRGGVAVTSGRRGVVGL